MVVCTILSRAKHERTEEYSVHGGFLRGRGNSWADRAEGESVVKGIHVVEEIAWS